MNLLLLVIGLVGPSLAHGQDVVLTVRNNTGVALQNAPVRGGVPFPVGRLKPGTRLALLDSSGRAVPVDYRPTARWYDGSVKWLLVDTQVTLERDATATFALATGASGGPALGLSQVSVRVAGDEILVETGPARFAFSKKRFGLPSRAWLVDRRSAKPAIEVVGPGSTLTCDLLHVPPGPPSEEDWNRDAVDGPRERLSTGDTGGYVAEIESSNRLHAVIKLSGWLVNPEGRRVLQYFIRAHAHAGKADLRISISLVYAGNPAKDFVRAIALRIPRNASQSTAWAFGPGPGLQGTLIGTESSSLLEAGPKKIYHLASYEEDKSVGYTVEARGVTTASGVEAPGWAQLSDVHGAMLLAVRNFSRMHPKEIELRRDAITLFLWPERGGKVLDLRRRYVGVENKFHYDLSQWEYGGEGIGVTHDFLLRLGPAPSSEAEAAAAELDNPLLLACEPAYYSSTRVLGAFAVSDPVHFPRLEALQAAGVAWIRRNQRAFHWDGMIDYGDTFFHGLGVPSHYGYVHPRGWASRGYVGWLNDDGGLTNALFVQYLRTGRYETFRLAEDMARHSMDVDTCHLCRERPGAVGGGHRHDQQHWGNDVRGYGTATHGIIDYYLLTGNERALDVAKETAAFHDRGESPEDEDRVGGLIRFWEISGDEHYKKRADELLSEELAVPADAQWRFRTPPFFRMVANTSVGFMFYLDAVPPPDGVRLRTAILESAQASRRQHMSSWDEAGDLPMLITSMAFGIGKDHRYAEQTAALLQRIRVPTTENLALAQEDFLWNSPFSAFVDSMVDRLGINNVHTLTIHGLVPLPYVEATLSAAQLDENGALHVPRATDPGEPFEEALEPGRMIPDGGRAYRYVLEHGAPSEKEGTGAGFALFEDGRLLGPAAAPHSAIRAIGAGRYSHWGARSLWFSASDSSDPRTNGRRYTAQYQVGPESLPAPTGHGEPDPSRRNP